MRPVGTRVGPISREDPSPRFRYKIGNHSRRGKQFCSGLVRSQIVRVIHRCCQNVTKQYVDILMMFAERLVVMISGLRITQLCDGVRDRSRFQILAALHRNAYVCINLKHYSDSVWSSYFVLVLCHHCTIVDCTFN